MTITILPLKFALQNKAKLFGMEISPEKSETMAVLGQGPSKM